MSAVSEAEEAFAEAWAQTGIPVEREFHFHPTRGWRFDFAWPAARVALEIEGVGRHQTNDGVRKDCEKYNTARLYGWTVFTVPACDKDESLDETGRAGTLDWRRMMRLALRLKGIR